MITNREKKNTINNEAFANYITEALCTVNPVALAKANPENIVVAEMNGTYFIDMNDIKTYMEASNNDSIESAINNIIEANNIDFNNICIMLDENTLEYSYDLDAIDCIYETGMKVTDYPIGAQRLVTKIFTAIKSKAAGIKGGKEASVAEYDKAIAKVKAVIDRIEEEREEHRKNPKKMAFKTGVKVIASIMIKLIPATILLATGSYVLGYTIDGVKGGSQQIRNFLKGFGIGVAGDTLGVGIMSAAYYDDMLDQAKTYCEKTINDLEKAKAKIANK